MTFSKHDICVSSKSFFFEMINESKIKVKFQPSETASYYLVDLMDSFLYSAPSVEEIDKESKSKTLAESFLNATSSYDKCKIKLLKKLADTTLYVSGFFGDSLNRKLIDIDYYINMGETAYETLAKSINESTFSELYMEFAQKFMNFVELLTYISLKVNLQSDEDVLRLYEKYLVTGSTLAKNKLIEEGLNLPEK